MMLRNLMSLLEILMPLVAMIAIFGLLCKILMNIYNKIYAHNLYYGFDYVDSIEWTIIIVITIFFMPATSRTISITLLALAIVNNILLFPFCRKTDKYSDLGKIKHNDKVVIGATPCRTSNKPQKKEIPPKRL